MFQGNTAATKVQSVGARCTVVKTIPTNYKLFSGGQLSHIFATVLQENTWRAYLMTLITMASRCTSEYGGREVKEKQCLKADKSIYVNRKPSEEARE